MGKAIAIRWSLLGMWGLYAFSFVPFLPTSATYVGLFLLGVLGTAAALTSVIRRRMYPLLFLLLSLLYLLVFVTSMFTAKYLSEAAEANAGGAIGKFFNGSVLLIGARIDSGHLWTAFTVAYAQLAMPLLAALVTVFATLHIMKPSRGGVP